ncbi:WXG100 family type VII secretion target [Frankia sp. AiPs1]|uniref:hypothetical protein n=1 Tax=Frankia sp. AiPa1 TaxID=573492 RepID=UPI00202B643C|nr:hypothetical protein [Frankia sp. AiPa1]MCL9758046.1 hypothetical protein [Frankia sp. AiPa1]
MAVSEPVRASMADALVVARQVQAEVDLALARVAAAGVDAWEGPAAEVSTSRLRRLAAEATAVLADCVRLCEQAGSAAGPPGSSVRRRAERTTGPLG